MIKEKLTIKAINKDYQKLINKWIKQQYNYINVTNDISILENEYELSNNHTLARKEERIYSTIIEIENELPTRELTNAKKGFKKFFGYVV
jgi:ATP-dependent helicase/DNAse subunit B